MKRQRHHRDYSLVGTESDAAVTKGLAGASWRLSPVQREQLLALMKRRNNPAAFHTVLWLALLVASGVWLATTWLSWWTLPAAFVYGTLYGSASDARWHECGHRTAFASKRANDTIYHLASFMDIREPMSWRWSHNRHHADTIIVGRDSEISFKRNVPLYRYVLEMVGFSGIPAEFKKLVRNACGVFPADQRDYQPEETLNTSKWASRAYLAVMALVIGLAIGLRSFEPLMYAVLPSFYGRVYLTFLGISQHAGLAEDVTDHRLNTRTVYMNPINRWIYWNMNYHIEHHMFPSVPFHQLKRLHETVKHELPTPYPSVWSTLKEIVPTLRKQATDDTYFVKRAVPTAGA